MPSISIDEWWSDRLTPFSDQKNHFSELENKDGFISTNTTFNLCHNRTYHWWWETLSDVVSCLNASIVFPLFFILKKSHSTQMKNPTKTAKPCTKNSFPPLCGHFVPPACSCITWTPIMFCCFAICDSLEMVCTSCDCMLWLIFVKIKCASPLFRTCLEAI